MSRKIVFVCSFLAVLLALSVSGASAVTSIGTSITYHGSLLLSGIPVNKTCDFQFGLWNASSSGTRLGAVQTVTSVKVVNGWYTVQLNSSNQFGTTAFNGEARWLGVSVRCPAGSGSYVALSPRVLLAAVPYAQHSTNANLLDGQHGSYYQSAANLNAGTLSTSRFSAYSDLSAEGYLGNAAADLARNNGVLQATLNADLLDGQHAGDFWMLGGNAVDADSVFGTFNDWALNIIVNNSRILSLQPNATSPNIIGGFEENWVGADVYGAVIDGGGEVDGLNAVFDNYSTIGGGVGNQAGSDDSDPENDLLATIGGGGNNVAGAKATVGGGTCNNATGPGSTIAGGDCNTASAWKSTVGGGGSNNASSEAATIAGGEGNSASGAWSVIAGGAVNEASGDTAAIGGGKSNIASGVTATVAGGLENTADGGGSAIGGGGNNTASGAQSTVGGGNSNTANGLQPTVGGGWSNTATGDWAVVGGGGENIASGNQATVAGGSNNTASGNGSFAAGHRAQAANDGAFVWADLSDFDFSSITDNEFAVRAAGGVRFVTNGAGMTVDGSTVWHAGNDGAASGLDADLLDGLGSIAFLQAGQSDSVTSTMITDGTVTFADWNSNGCDSGQVSKWNGSAWACADDDAGSADADTLDGQHAAAFWNLGGNGGTTPGTNFLGTTDNQPLEFRINNSRVLLINFGWPPYDSPNIIGGYSGNWITNGVEGAFIGGGGFSGLENRITDIYGVIGGGANNQAGDNAGSPGDMPGATVSGGVGNIASQDYSTIGGGGGNTANNSWATVGGGAGNTASGEGATVSGGGSNSASGLHAFVGGGWTNSASGDQSTIPGGDNNTAAGDYSFVTGHNAANIDTSHDGVFLFADSNDIAFPSTAANQFRVRATGGTQFVSAIDGGGTPTAGVQLASGGGSWSSLSDRALKANFAAVNGDDVLAAIASLPISTWNYKAQAQTIRHIGPMAQDFYTAFGVGEDDTHITSVDADGVALAGIQALYQQNRQLEARLAALEGQGASLAGPASGVVVPLPWLLFGGLLLLNCGFLAGRRWSKRR